MPHIVGYESRKTLDLKLQQAGGLAEEVMSLPEDELSQVVSLKVSGDMNGTDFLALNKMTNIIDLNLADATIVAGGYYYDDGKTKYETEADTFKANQLYALDILRTLVLPDNLKVIGASAFQGYDFLTSLNIPGAVTEIGGGAFSGSPLTSVSLPNSLITIGNDAFNGSDLTSVSIPESVTTLGAGAFSNCASLAEVSILAPLSEISPRAFQNTPLTSVSIPNSVTSIGEEAFSGCTRLASVTIPNSVTTIQDKAFYGCSAMTEVSLGTSVASIGSQAFVECPALNTIISLNTTPPSIYSDTFDNYDKTVYVPSGCKSDYWLHPYWSKFTEIKEFDPSGVNGVENEDAMLPTEYFNLSGVKVMTVAPGEEPSGLAPGIYVSRRGNKSSKVVIR